MAPTGLYGSHWISVQAVACTEIISFPYTPSGLDPPSSKFGLNHPRIAGIRKRVRFRTACFPDCVLKGFVARAIRLYEQGPGEAEAFARLGLYVRRWVRWVRAGLPLGIAEREIQRQQPPIRRRSRTLLVGRAPRDKPGMIWECPWSAWTTREHIRQILSIESFFPARRNRPL